jgi:ABC-2 type transport system permease protein
MMSSVFLRSVYEKRWFFVGWSVAFFAMSALIMLFYPAFNDSQGFGTIAKTLPGQLKGFIGDPDQFRTISGYIAGQVYGVRISLLLIIMALMLALSYSIKDEENGDLRSLLSLKISRTKFALHRLAAAVVIMAGINVVTSTGVIIGIIALGETIPWELILRACLLSILFGATAFSIPFAVGLASGRRGVTMTVGLVIAIGSYLLSTFSRSVDWLKSWDIISLMHYYHTSDLGMGHFNLEDLWVLSLLILFSTSIGILIFRRRDIG